MLAGLGAGSVRRVDPWCTDVRARREEGQELYLAVRATQCSTRPLRVTACGCGCDDADCEYSRTRDSFEVAVLTELPQVYEDQATTDPLLAILGFASAFACVPGPRVCPPCPPSPWVVLADLALDAEGHVTPTGAPPGATWSRSPATPSTASAIRRRRSSGSRGCSDAPRTRCTSTLRR